jgi:hypothetical protein
MAPLKFACWIIDGCWFCLVKVCPKIARLKQKRKKRKKKKKKEKKKGKKILTKRGNWQHNIQPNDTPSNITEQSSKQCKDI